MRRETQRAQCSFYCSQVFSLPERRKLVSGVSYLGLFQGQNYNLRWTCPWVEQQVRALPTLHLKAGEKQGEKSSSACQNHDNLRLIGTTCCKLIRLLAYSNANMRSFFLLFCEILQNRAISNYLVFSSKSGYDVKS